MYVIIITITQAILYIFELNKDDIQGGRKILATHSSYKAAIMAAQPNITFDSSKLGMRSILPFIFFHVFIYFCLKRKI